MLDGRACECCRTSAAPTPDGMAVVYRDRCEKEVRDTSIAQLKNGQWSEQPLSQDGWEINGCPVNQVAVDRRRRDEIQRPSADRMSWRQVKGSNEK